MCDGESRNDTSNLICSIESCGEIISHSVTEKSAGEHIYEHLSSVYYTAYVCVKSKLKYSTQNKKNLNCDHVTTNASNCSLALEFRRRNSLTSVRLVTGLSSFSTVLHNGRQIFSNSDSNSNLLNNKRLEVTYRLLKQ